MRSPTFTKISTNTLSREETVEQSSLESFIRHVISHHLTIRSNTLRSDETIEECPLE